MSQELDQAFDDVASVDLEQLSEAARQRREKQGNQVVIVLQPHEAYKVPLTYMLPSSDVDVHIQLKPKEQLTRFEPGPASRGLDIDVSEDLEDEEQGSMLLFKSISSVFNLSNSETVDQSRFVSKIVELNDDFYVSVDL